MSAANANAYACIAHLADVRVHPQRGAGVKVATKTEGFEHALAVGHMRLRPHVSRLACRLRMMQLVRAPGDAARAGHSQQR